MPQPSDQEHKFGFPFVFQRMAAGDAGAMVIANLNALAGWAQRAYDLGCVTGRRAEGSVHYELYAVPDTSPAESLDRMAMLEFRGDAGETEEPAVPPLPTASLHQRIERQIIERALTDTPEQDDKLFASGWITQVEKVTETWRYAKSGQSRFTGIQGMMAQASALQPLSDEETLLKIAVTAIVALESLNRNAYKAELEKEKKAHGK